MNLILCVFRDWIWGKMNSREKGLDVSKAFSAAPVEKHGSCLDSHLGSQQRSLNCALLARDQPTLWGSQGPQASPWTKLKRKIYFLPQRIIMKFQARRSFPELTGAHACCAHLWQSALTNSYKGLFFRTGCRKAPCYYLSICSTQGTHGIIKSISPGKNSDSSSNVIHSQASSTGQDINNKRYPSQNSEIKHVSWTEYCPLLGSEPCPALSR